MKLKSMPIILLVSLVLGLWCIGPVSTANAQEVIRYACSNQIYAAFEKEKIDVFTRKTGIHVNVYTSSSHSCVYRMKMGFADIASTARKLYRRQSIFGFNEFPFCRDPIAVIARKECGVQSLTEEQLQDIFAGDITNWEEVGGANLPVMIIVPGKDSAAHKNFRRHVMKEKDIAHDFTAHDATMVIEAIKHFACGAVAFSSQGAAVQHEDLVTVRINGYAPTDKEYPYDQIFYYITKGELSGNIKKFIDYTYSETGSEIIRKHGMLPIAR